MKGFSLAFVLVLIVQSCTSSSYFKDGYLLPSDSEPVEIPFTLEKGLIVLNAEVNGVSGRFLFDNGFSLSAVDPEFAQKAGIQFDQKSTISDANSKSQKISRTNVDSIEVGTQKFMNTGFYEIETSNFWSCTELDGIIGASIINKANWKIDFQDSLLWISSTPFEDKGIQFDYRISTNNGSFIELQIDGKTFKTKIDFGKSGELDLDFNRAKRLFENDSVEVQKGIMSLSATGPGETEMLYSLAEYQPVIVDGITLPLQTKTELSHDLKYQGYLGAGYFKHYQVIINSNEQKYILRNEQPSPQLSSLSYGFAIYPLNEEWKIIRKNPIDSDLIGVNLMDTIVEIDGLSVSQFADNCELNNLLTQKKKAQESIRIKTLQRETELNIPYNKTTLTTFNSREE